MEPAGWISSGVLKTEGQSRFGCLRSGFSEGETDGDGGEGEGRCTRPALMELNSVGVVVFATERGLSKMKPDGTESAELVALTHPTLHMLGIEEWMP